MDLLLNGAFVLGVVYLGSGFITASMTLYFLFLSKANGLKSILVHLFGAWAAHYLIVGAVTFLSFVLRREILPLSTLRLLAAAFVTLQLVALFRLYFYIKKWYG